MTSFFSLRSTQSRSIGGFLAVFPLFTIVLHENLDSFNSVTPSARRVTAYHCLFASLPKRNKKYQTLPYAIDSHVLKRGFRIIFPRALSLFLFFAHRFHHYYALHHFFFQSITRALGATTLINRICYQSIFLAIFVALLKITQAATAMKHSAKI